MNILDKMPKKLIEIMLKEGLTFSISQSELGFYLDLNTGMKSHAHLYYENSKYVLRMRYGEEAEVGTLHDIGYWVRNCLQGRDFMKSAWAFVVDNKGFGLVDELEIQ